MKTFLIALGLWILLCGAWLLVLWLLSPERYLLERRQAGVESKLRREAQRQAHASACRTRESYRQIKYREVP